MGFVKSLTPRGGYVLGARTPHEFLRMVLILLLDSTGHHTPGKKQENWSSQAGFLIFLFDNGCILH